MYIYIYMQCFLKKVIVKGEVEWTWIQFMHMFSFGFGHFDHQFSWIYNFDP